jgi:outer membrane protein OmpA-like peptidoglycan-associated protein
MAGKHDLSHAFTDLMTSLAIIFILLLVASTQNKRAEANNNIESVRKAIKEKLPQRFKLEQDRDDPYTQIINLDNNRLKFSQDKSDISEDGVQEIGILFRAIAPNMCTAGIREKIESIIVEGHASDDGDEDQSGRLGNVKLSQARAFEVLAVAIQYVEKDAETLRAAPDRPDSSNLDLDCVRKLSSATGRGSSRPLPNASKEQNRRVEIKIRVKAPNVINKTELFGDVHEQK